MKCFFNAIEELQLQHVQNLSFPLSLAVVEKIIITSKPFKKVQKNINKITLMVNFTEI